MLEYGFVFAVPGHGVCRSLPPRRLSVKSSADGPARPGLHLPPRHAKNPGRLVASVSQTTEDSAYYEYARPEIVALVPRDARSIVDVGCAGGALGSALKAERPGVSVRGVEMCASAAERARLRLDDVFIGSAEAGPPAEWPRADCLIFADVLEHLANPLDVLCKWKQSLAPGGTVMASIPNVAHHSIVRDLLRGRWEYTDAGILDRTHLRFFTRETILDLFAGASLTPTRIERVTSYGKSSRMTRLVDSLGRGPLQRGNSMSRLVDPWTIQFLVTAKPAS